MSLDPVYAYFEGDEQIYLKYMELAQSGVRPSSREVRNPIYLGLANEEGYPHLGYMDFVDNKLDPAIGRSARAPCSTTRNAYLRRVYSRV